MTTPSKTEAQKRKHAETERERRRRIREGLPPRRLTLAQRLDVFIRRADEADCWLWTGQLHNEGYGTLHAAGRTRYAHRVVYEQFVGPIPDGLQLDHLCRVRACVNPLHLEPVTPAENNARRPIIRNQNTGVTHCKRGHEFTPENTYVHVSPRGTRRICRACKRASEVGRVRKRARSKAGQS